MRRDEWEVYFFFHITLKLRNSAGGSGKKWLISWMRTDAPAGASLVSPITASLTSHRACVCRRQAGNFISALRIDASGSAEENGG